MKKEPRTSIVVAITSKHAAIGQGGDLVVRIPDDLKRFRAITSGHAIIMGRKTYQSIGRALPGRPNFIVTRDPAFRLIPEKDGAAPDATVCGSLDEAVRLARERELANDAIPAGKKEIFLIGGGEIYRQGLPITDKIYLTVVESDLEGDVGFPDYSDFKKVVRREDRVDDVTGMRYSWIDLER